MDSSQHNGGSTSDPHMKTSRCSTRKGWEFPVTRFRLQPGASQPSPSSNPTTPTSFTALSNSPLSHVQSPNTSTHHQQNHPHQQQQQQQDHSQDHPPLSDSPFDPDASQSSVKKRPRLASEDKRVIHNFISHWHVTRGSKRNFAPLEDEPEADLATPDSIHASPKLEQGIAQRHVSLALQLESGSSKREPRPINGAPLQSVDGVSQTAVHKSFSSQIDSWTQTTSPSPSPSSRLVHTQVQTDPVEITSIPTRPDSLDSDPIMVEERRMPHERVASVVTLPSVASQKTSAEQFAEKHILPMDRAAELVQTHGAIMFQTTVPAPLPSPPMSSRVQIIKEPAHMTPSQDVIPKLENTLQTAQNHASSSRLSVDADAQNSSATDHPIFPNARPAGNRPRLIISATPDAPAPFGAVQLPPILKEDQFRPDASYLSMRRHSAPFIFHPSAPVLPESAYSRYPNIHNLLIRGGVIPPSPGSSSAFPPSMSPAPVSAPVNPLNIHSQSVQPPAFQIPGIEIDRDVSLLKQQQRLPPQITLRRAVRTGHEDLHPNTSDVQNVDGRQSPTGSTCTTGTTKDGQGANHQVPTAKENTDEKELKPETTFETKADKDSFLQNSPSSHRSSSLFDQPSQPVHPKATSSILPSFAQLDSGFVEPSAPIRRRNSIAEPSGISPQGSMLPPPPGLVSAHLQDLGFAPIQKPLHGTSIHHGSNPYSVPSSGAQMLTSTPSPMLSLPPIQTSDEPLSKRSAADYPSVYKRPEQTAQLHSSQKHPSSFVHSFQPVMNSQRPQPIDSEEFHNEAMRIQAARGRRWSIAAYSPAASSMDPLIWMAHAASQAHEQRKQLQDENDQRSVSSQSSGDSQGDTAMSSIPSHKDNPHIPKE